jgi:ankyrin repeat protein
MVCFVPGDRVPQNRYPSPLVAGDLHLPDPFIRGILASRDVTQAMNPSQMLIRTTLLSLFTLAMLTGVIVTDFYLRHEETRKAKRFLASQGVELSVGSSIAAAEKGDILILESLEKAGISLSSQDSQGKTPLIAAVAKRQPVVVDFLLERDTVTASINVQMQTERASALTLALRDRDFALAERLLKVGADIDLDQEAGLPFLVAAVQSKDREMLDFLISHGADVDYRSAQPTTALALAAEAQDLPLMGVLLKAGANPDVRGVSGKPLLIEAVKAGDGERAKLLLSNKADVNIEVVESHGQKVTALSYAYEQGYKAIAGLLLGQKASADAASMSGGSLLTRSISDRDTEFAKLLLGSGANPNGRTGEEETPLHAAIRLEDLDLVDVLLAADADPSYAGAEAGHTPLLAAVETGNIAMANQLIVAGAKLDTDTLLAQAYDKRDDPLMSLLLNAGADPESIYRSTGERVFDVAIREGASGAVRTLLAAGAKIGDNLWAALLTGEDDLVRLILEAGADPSQKGADGQDPLHYCLLHQKYKVARILLEGGANPNSSFSAEETWLAKSIREGNAPIALALVESGAAVKDVKTADGHTLLAWAIAHQMTDVATALLKAGVDPNATERSPARDAFAKMFESTTFRYHLEVDTGVRPLMMAAAQRNHDIAQALMDSGAKGNVYTRKYLFPVGIGAWYKDTRMMQIVLLGKVPEVQPRRLVIDLSSQRLTLYENEVATFNTPVSTGMSGFRTPPGEYVISDKHRDHTSTIYHSSMPFFQRFSCAAFGIHQGHLPGYPASHGCIRLPYESARFLFGKLEVGDYALIQE